VGIAFTFEERTEDILVGGDAEEAGRPSELRRTPERKKKKQRKGKK
jgi:hypothetical protein